MNGKKLWLVAICIIVFIVVPLIASGLSLWLNGNHDASKNAAPTATPTATATSQPLVVKSEHKERSTFRLSDDQELVFQKGETVAGYQLIFSNGAIYYDAQVIDSPYSGTVASGWIWPSDETKSDYAKDKWKIINPLVDKPEGYYHERVTTNGSTNNTLSFDKGDTVYGYALSFSNGKTYYGAAVKNSPYSGTVSYGVIAPKYKELTDCLVYEGRCKLIDPMVDQSWILRHRELSTNISPNGTLPFNKGDTVLGKELLFSNGVLLENVAIVDSPYSGTVTQGTIWPKQSEIDNFVDYDEGRIVTKKDVQ